MYTIIQLQPYIIQPYFLQTIAIDYHKIYYLHCDNRKPFKLPLIFTEQLEYAMRYADIKGYAEDKRN